jgi:hypothetical protein
LGLLASNLPPNLFFVAGIERRAVKTAADLAAEAIEPQK